MSWETIRNRGSAILAYADDLTTNTKQRSELERTYTEIQLEGKNMRLTRNTYSKKLNTWEYVKERTEIE